MARYVDVINQPLKKVEPKQPLKKVEPKTNKNIKNKKQIKIKIKKKIS